MVEFTARGVNGELTVTSTKITIARKGALAFLTQGMKGEKDISIESISSIQLKKATNFTNGYIQFAFMGGKETKGGLLDATQDENSIMFRIGQQAADFATAKDLIEQYQHASRKPHTHGTTSDLDQLAKLAALRDSGILTEEEFVAKKKQILGI